MNIWIFQSTPKRWKLLNSLRKQFEGRVWEINQHKNEIKKGDIALLWMAGKEAGIYAVVRITSDPDFMYAPPEDEEDWVREDEPDRGKKLYRVKIDVTQDISSTPILRDEIRKIEKLENLSILKYPRGTNFPVTADEWAILKGMIEKASQH